MNPLQIEYFQAVAYYKNFTNAANELHVSQPAVSKQISALEEELGVTLFDRTGRKAELTLSGEVFLNYFRRAGEEFENTKHLAKELEGKTREKKLSVKITFFIDWDSNVLVLPLLDYFDNIRPKMELDMENRGLHDIAASLTDSKSDLTICFDYMIPESFKENMESAVLTKVHSMVYFSQRHSLAKKEGLRFEDFRNDSCVIPKHPAPEKYIRSLATEFYGFEPKFQIKQNHDSMLMSVQSGRGYCVLDEWSRNRTNSSFRTLPLEHSETVSVYWRRNNKNPAVPMVLEALREIMKE